MDHTPSQSKTDSSSSRRGVTLTIRVPDIDFSGTQRIWDSSSTHKSLFFSAFSVVGPTFERIACKALRMVRDRVANSTLLDEVKSFTAQEAMHAKLHAQYNEKFIEQHYEAEASSFFALLDRAAEEYYRLSEIDQVAVVVAAEHIIAQVGHWILRPDVHATMCSEMRTLLMWHSFEEIEHGSVTADVYRQVFGDGVHAYAHRVKGMLLAVHFIMETIVPIYRMLLAKEIAVHGYRERLAERVARYAKLTHFLWFQTRPMLAFFLPKFAPWEGNYHLYLEWRAQYASAVATVRNLD